VKRESVQSPGQRNDSVRAGDDHFAGDCLIGGGCARLFSCSKPHKRNDTADGGGVGAFKFLIAVTMVSKLSDEWATSLHFSVVSSIPTAPIG